MKFKLYNLIIDYELANTTQLTEKEISSRTGINRTTINRIKLSHPSMNPRLSTLIKLAQFFDCTLNDLVDIHSEDED